MRTHTDRYSPLTVPIFYDSGQLGLKAEDAFCSPLLRYSVCCHVHTHRYSPNSLYLCLYSGELGVRAEDAPCSSLLGCSGCCHVRSCCFLLNRLVSIIMCERFLLGSIKLRFCNPLPSPPSLSLFLSLSSAKIQYGGQTDVSDWNQLRRLGQ